MSTRAKGRRTLNKAKEYYESNGWKVDECELGGRYRKSRDLFSSEDFPGFDLVAIKPGRVRFIQVKTNTPAIQGPYKQFAKRYCGNKFSVECWTWYDRQGPVIHRYYKNGKVKRFDERQ